VERIPVADKELEPVRWDGAMRNETRNGIAAVGMWTVDHVREVDIWPPEENVAYILKETSAGGGLAYNVLVDLAKFDLGIPLEGTGCVGDDEDGRFLLAECDDYGIDRSNVLVSNEARTSYTEVMSVQSTGKRTFFHSRGANSLLTYETTPFDRIHAAIVHFGYLLAMQGFDAPDPEFGTVAAKILHRFQEMGFSTSVDVVSERSERFLRIVPPALKYTDFLILNEFEAGQTTGHAILEGGNLDGKVLRDSAAQLLNMGSAQLVVIHMPLCAYALTRDGEELFEPSLDVPDDYVKSTVGAGDAFCAGMLAGIHEGWELHRSLQFATAAGAAALGHPTTTGGLGPVAEIWELLERFPLRSIAI
jgi:sugar/nucleoside kinase (ribokinase family)